MIIDSHVHFPFSLPIPEEDWGRFLVERAALSGISAVIVSDVFIRGRQDAGSYPSSAALRFANSYAAEQARKNPGRLYFLAYLNPQNPDWEEELEKSVTDGAVGVKLWVALKDEKGSLENSVKVLKKAAAKKLPVLIHTFARTEANSPGEVDIAEFVELSNLVPECVLIGGHSGANFRESTGMFRKASANTYWDISGTNPDCSMVPEVVKEAGADRVLFGSDGPGMHSWVINSKGEYLITQRAANRVSYPLMFECVGGSVLQGETSIQGAIREIVEEVGLVFKETDGKLFKTEVRDFVNGKKFSDIMDAWLFKYDGEVDLSKATTDEVCFCKWVTIDEIKEIFDSGKLVPTLEYIFELDSEVQKLKNNFKKNDKKKKIKKLSERSRYFDFYDDIKSGCHKIVDW